MGIDRELSEKLIGLLKTSKKALSEYDRITKTIGYTFDRCEVCNGTGKREVFVGNDCNGSNYEDRDCFCYKGYEFNKIVEKEEV